MAWNRGATLLSVLLFLAFGFEVVGVFSEPVSRNKLSLATYKGYAYGVLGYCPTDGSKACSKAALGYEMHDSDDFSFGKSGQHILTQLFISQIVAAGCLLISFILALVSMVENVRFYIAFGVWLALIFLLTVLVFLSEILLFGKHLKFAGWFTLVAAVLTIISLFVLGFMYRSLRSRLGSTNVQPTDADPLFGDFVSYPKGSDFVIGRDDEKRPRVDTAFQSFVPPKPPAVSAPALKSVNVQQGYQRIPESNGGPPAHSVKSKASRDDWRGGAGAGYGPGAPAVAGMRHGRQTDVTPPRGPPRPQGAVPVHAPPSGPGGSASAFVPPVPQRAVPPPHRHPQQAQPQQQQQQRLRQPPPDNAGANAVPRSQREETWSQIALQRANESDARPPRGHASQDSVASSQAARIPAGAYVPGVDAGRSYGPNVVKIPKVREPQAAVLDYQDDAHAHPTGSRQGNHAGVPNFSRLSAGAAEVMDPRGSDGAAREPRQTQQPTTPQKMNPMLQRYVDAVPHPTDTADRAPEPFYDVPNLRMVSESPAGSDSSHYTSVSERHAQTAPSQPLPPPPHAIAPGRQRIAPPQAYGKGPAQYGPSQHYPQQYAPQQYAPQQYGPQQFAPQPYGHQPHAPQMYSPQSYGSQQQYAPPQQYMPQQPVYVSPKPAQRSGPQRSEFALNNNPDFSLGEIGSRKRRPNRGPTI